MFCYLKIMNLGMFLSILVPLWLQRINLSWLFTVSKAADTLDNEHQPSLDVSAEKMLKEQGHQASSDTVSEAT
ncbi:unnamed protein product [Eruca vesicaria subsp. sativa]|uniref:Uncharacterized protein n=1 Tax=Eruca vesicaria subsp. sativa TaxID=29727 RepID=A0ABC8KL90_ERUVS|nr:unnamed protein product [Eruca vesicaria subsp. sativa]